MAELDTSTGRGRDTAEEDSVARLIRSAGPPPAVSPQALAELRRETRRHWHHKVETRRQGRRANQRRWLAAAAAVVVSVGATLLWQGGRLTTLSTGTTIAHVESVVGGSWSAPDSGLVAGAELATEAGVRVALRLADGTSLRLDGGSRVVLDGPSALTLAAGGVYLDSGDRQEDNADGILGASLEVRTPFGLARDIGTQFEVRLAADSLQVRVREGEVRVDTADGSHGAVAGDYLRISADGMVERQQEATHGGPWSWVQEVAPALDLEGKSLGEALRWMEHETGWQVVFAPSELADRADEIIIHGAVQDLRPGEVPEVLLPSSGLHSVLHQGVLRVCSEVNDCENSSG